MRKNDNNDGYSSSAASLLASVGPDIEGCCPSDLVGMERHEQLAEWLAEQEKRLITEFLLVEDIMAAIDGGAVSWLSCNAKYTEGGDFVWGKWGGSRRM